MLHSCKGNFAMSILPQRCVQFISEDNIDMKKDYRVERDENSHLIF